MRLLARSGTARGPRAWGHGRAPAWPPGTARGRARLLLVRGRARLLDRGRVRLLAGSARASSSDVREQLELGLEWSDSGKRKGWSKIGITKKIIHILTV